MARPILILLFAAALFPLAGPAPGGEVKIYRDGWGVPHIYGQTPEDAAYGFGYAQAEDRLEALLVNYLTAVGAMASAFGPEHIDADFRQRLWGHGRVSRERYAELDPGVRRFIEAFVAGIAAYMRHHPQRTPDWAFAPEPYHVVALGRYLAFRELERQADREYRGLPPEPAPGNLWAVSRERSAEDAALLLIDPHRVWNGPARWYETHLHGNGLHAFGFTCPGLPVLLLGHNDSLGWGFDRGGSDGADVYEIELEAPDAARYRYDGAWKPIQTDTVHIRVNLGGRTETRVRSLQRTHHGPLLHRQGRRAYACRFPLADQVRQVEQLYRQMAAPDLKSFHAALELAQTGPCRFVCADVEGNLFYIRTGRIPVRPELYRWDRPVPGNTAATDWDSVHAQNDLLQVLNPDSGWLQDCGAAPDRVTPAGPLTPDRYPDYLFNGPAAAESPRSARARELLSAISRMTLQEAFDTALDTYIVGSERWLRALRLAYASHGAEFAHKYPGLEPAIRILNRWNGRADREEIGMAVYARWRRFCAERGREINARHILSLQEPGEQTRRALLEALGLATLDMLAKDGRLEVFWGEVHRMRRAGRSWPVSGSAGEGLAALRAVSATPDLAVSYGDSGQSCTTIVLLRGPGRVESFSALPFGQSDDPDSPHAWDQAEALFSPGRLKPTGYRKTDGLKLQHTLAVPPR